MPQPSDKGAVAAQPGGKRAEDLSAASSEAKAARDLRSYREAAGRQLSLWQAWLDELRVQAHLARLDTQAEALARLDQAEGAYAAARQRLATLAEEAEDRLEPVRSGMAELLDELSKRSADLAEHLRRPAG